MNKKANTWLFMLGATVFNVLITIVIFLGLFVLYAALLAERFPQTAGWSVPVIFIGAIALAFVAYRFILKQVLKRIDMDKYFDPIFGRKAPPKRKD
jgi:hypothetical protein